MSAQAQEIRFGDGSLSVKFWKRVSPDVHGCWIWTGPIDSDEYGRFNGARTHRLTYSMLVGPIPSGLQIDHLCRVHRCCNPTHLEPVTIRENSLRSPLKRLKTHCVHGHEFTAENTHWNTSHKFPRRGCRTCRRAGGRTATKQLLATPRVARTHCPQGHLRTAENLGRRGSCRPCSNAGRLRRHAEIASGQRAIPSNIPHGSASTYMNWACRCDPCKAAKQQSRRARRAIDEARPTGRKLASTNEVHRPSFELLTEDRKAQRRAHR